MSDGCRSFETLSALAGDKLDSCALIASCYYLAVGVESMMWRIEGWLQVDSAEASAARESALREVSEMKCTEALHRAEAAEGIAATTRQELERLMESSDQQQSAVMWARVLEAEQGRVMAEARLRDSESCHRVPASNPAGGEAESNLRFFEQSRGASSRAEGDHAAQEYEDSLRTQLAKREAQAVQLVQQLEAAQDANQTSTVQMAELCLRLVEAEKEKDAVEKEKVEIAKEKDSIREEKESMQRELELRGGALEASRRGAARMSEMNTADRAHLSERMEILQRVSDSRSRALQVKLTNEEANNTAAQQELVELATELAESNVMRADLEAQAQARVGQISDLTSELAASSSKLEALRVELSSSQTTMAEERQAAAAARVEHADELVGLQRAQEVAEKQLTGAVHLMMEHGQGVDDQLQNVRQSLTAANAQVVEEALALQDRAARSMQDAELKVAHMVQRLTLESERADVLTRVLQQQQQQKQRHADVDTGEQSREFVGTPPNPTPSEDVQVMATQVEVLRQRCAEGEASVLQSEIETHKLRSSYVNACVERDAHVEHVAQLSGELQAARAALDSQFEASTTEQSRRRERVAMLEGERDAILNERDDWKTKAERAEVAMVALTQANQAADSSRNLAENRNMVMSDQLLEARTRATRAEAALSLAEELQAKFQKHSGAQETNMEAIIEKSQRRASQAEMEGGRPPPPLNSTSRQDAIALLFSRIGSSERFAAFLPATTAGGGRTVAEEARGRVRGRGPAEREKHRAAEFQSKLTAVSQQLAHTVSMQEKPAGRVAAEAKAQQK
ncbi:hypothetical protein CYMTET_35167, partial [Cymbomonas tetramitiformis]